jgi:hypothetical protein
MQYLETILDELDRSRERLLVALEMLPDEALLAPEVVGEYSIADCLAMQTAWEAELVTGFLRMDRGQKPDNLLQAMADSARYEEKWVAENRERDLDAIFDDFQGVRVQLEEWLETFSEKDLTNPRRFNWLKERSLADVVAALTYERETGFIPAIEAFSAQWLAEEGETFFVPPTDLLIPLTAVSLEDDTHDNNQPD